MCSQSTVCLSRVTSLILLVCLLTLYTRMTATDVIRGHALMTNDVSRRHSGVRAETGAYLQCAVSFAAVTLAVRKVILA